MRTVEFYKREMIDVKSILKYWYELEFFKPCWPIDFSEDINLANEKIPWPKIEDNKKKTYVIRCLYGES